MTEPEAQTLCDRICDFLISCGGAYKRLTGEMQWNVLHALGTRQFVMKEKDGEILYFASFWKIQPGAVQSVLSRIKPADLIYGSVVYVSEAANKGRRKDLAEMITGIRKQAGNAQGVLWHRPAKADKAYYFTRQKGKEV